ncbi:hypothetical protein [Paraferrimonas sp. SM1919]|uniref:hypothetical protein n=1 Tax=Paraferrimonas sp. SM1919 TaxID=2662263 RepID=UPI0013D2BADD|nr:hypothetical protein [Paraferrimonas sp. SM1919]
MLHKYIAITLLSTAILGCNSTAPKAKLTPAQLNQQFDQKVVDIVRRHQTYNPSCAVVTEQINQTAALNKQSGTDKQNNIFNYTSGMHALMLGRYPTEFQLARFKRLSSAFSMVEATCRSNPDMSYADALQGSLAKQINL